MYRFIISIVMLCMLSACAGGSNNRNSSNSDLQLSVQKKKEIAQAEQRLGESHYDSGNYVEALKKFLAAEELLPDDEYIQNSLGMVYMARNRYDLAQAHFERAIRINPEFYAAQNHLGASLMKQKKWDAAIKCFEAMSGNLLYATPENPLANLGWIYLEKKEYTTAKDYFLQALDIYPCFLVATHGLATAYIELIQYPEAVILLEKCLEKIPQAAILHADLARVYEATRDYASARMHWQMVLKLSPENSPLAREAEQKIN